MIDILKKVDGKLVPIEQAEKGCWINIYPPYNHEDLRSLSEAHDIPLDFLTDSLDIDERSRYEREDDVNLIVLNTPIRNDGINENESLFIAIPIGIIETEDFVLTLSAYKNPVIDSFLEGRVRRFDPADHSGFMLSILERNVYQFLFNLKAVNNMLYSYEKELYNSSRNEELKNLLNIQKSLVYFVTNLKSNELMMMKMHRTDFLRIKEDEDKADLLEDIITDNGQALEMSDIYTHILNGTMDAFGSIISNNLNTILKRLTSVTIILMVPTLVASFYGMNVKLPGVSNLESGLPFAMIMLVSILLSVMVVFIFMRNKWF